ncbi:N-acetylmuramoyl-L-alanine amidase family protein [Bacillus gaemokensis]|uniref:Cell wall hydrolase n=1 Tax=Bacillus gaemokensis TaxID=574375 RepID=A0A073KDR0_9BACI|nr:N-acetylmuramoyl-L-alanine amidase [Bacillus gaemokensis]KEK24592.1 cell wall hydrolase [Bacillus gaemokensis]KYG39478.1 cell wall hydrolase [Bacillus gaemokensis]
MKKMTICLLFILTLIGASFFLYKVEAHKQVTADDLRLKGKTIVIDPGHGGRDRGTKGKKDGTIEKDLNLKVAQNIKKELEERTDAKVILTREKDTSLLSETKQKEELQARVKIAKDYSADLYISIHHDAFEDTNVKGITTHYGSNKRGDKKLAKIVQKAIFNQNVDTRDRGAKGSDYLVLRENPVPAILIELGFTSNESDEKRMNSEEFQTKSKKGIVDGIIKYFTS